MWEWQKSIINYLYWSVFSSNDDIDDATSTPNEQIKTKWLSLDNHVHNVNKVHSKESP